MNHLGKNLKELRKKNKDNQSELAKKLKVSQTSVAHYEAGTRQPTIETLMAISKLYSIPIDKLVGNKIKTIKANKVELEVDEIITCLVEYLVNKNETSFNNLLRESVYPFYNLSLTIEDILKKVMYKIGDLWEENIITEADEHYATNVVRKVISGLNTDNETIKSKLAVSFTVGSEKHTLGIEMVNTYLKAQGVETIYLGSNLPIRSIEDVVTKHKPEYIFISITMKESMNSLIYLLEYLKAKYKEDIVIGIGGQGLSNEEDLKKHENIHILKSLNELIDLLN